MPGGAPAGEIPAGVCHYLYEHTASKHAGKRAGKLTVALLQRDWGTTCKKGSLAFHVKVEKRVTYPALRLAAAIKVSPMLITPDTRQSQI